MSYRNYILNIFCLSLFMSYSNSSIAQESFSLQEAIDYALENHNDIALKKIEIQDAIENVRELRAIGMPKVNGKIDYQYYFSVPKQVVEDFVGPSVVEALNSIPIDTVPIPNPPTRYGELSFFQKNNLNVAIEASILAFDGSYLAALEAAKLFKEFTREGIEVTEQTIRAGVTKAYLNVLILDKNRKILTENIENLEKSKFEIGQMYENGFLEKLDVDRLEVSYLNLKTELNKLNQTENLTKNVLKFQMDFPLEKDITLTEDLDLLIDEVRILEEVNPTEFDAKNRAEYEQINKGIQLNKLNVKRFQRGYLPSLVIFAQAQEQLARDRLFDNSTPGFIFSSSAGLSLNVPIFDGQETKAKVARAKLDVERRTIDLENFEKGILFQANNALLQYNNAKSSVETTERSLKLSEEIYNKSLIKFREGVGSSIEVTQSESALYMAQSSYVSALYSLLTTKIDLDIALGNL